MIVPSAKDETAYISSIRPWGNPTNTEIRMSKASLPYLACMHGYKCSDQDMEEIARAMNPFSRRYEHMRYNLRTAQIERIIDSKASDGEGHKVIHIDEQQFRIVVGTPGKKSNSHSKEPRAGVAEASYEVLSRRGRRTADAIQAIQFVEGGNTGNCEVTTLKPPNQRIRGSGAALVPGLV